MALLVATRPTSPNVGVVPTANAVNASDTIAAADLGTLGAYLRVTNGSGGSINVTVSDSSLSLTGNAATPVANAVANSATEMVYISPKALNLSTGVVTVTFSATTSVTAELYPLG